MKYFLVILMTILASIASFFLKKATIEQSYKGLLKNKFLYFGGFMYVFTALINIWLLQVLPYSVVVPLGALTYLWTIMLSLKLLGEKISRGKIIGVICIIIGVSCIAF